MANARGRNEGLEDLSYKPPKTFKKITSVDESVVEEGFEWDNINRDPNIDIWAMRIPAGFNPAELVGLKIKLPSTDTDEITGTLKTSGSIFKLRTVGGNDASGGEEMQNMHCIVPKTDEAGALYTVPRPIKHLILTPNDPTPTPTPTPAEPAEPSRRPQPIGRLKHTFLPIGASSLSLLPSSASAKPMEVDENPEASTESPKKKRKKQGSIIEIKLEIPKAKSKGKVTGKSKVADTGTEDTMEVDEPEVSAPKKSKKPAPTSVEVELQEEQAATKKGKKKRKSANDD